MQLSKFEIEDLEEDIVTGDDIREEVRDFRSTYGSIMNLVRQKKADNPQRNMTISSRQATNIASSPQLLMNPPANARKRPVPPTSTQSPVKRTKSTKQASSARPKTPDQPTVPRNPGSSGDSTESTDEDLTRTFINTVLDDARSCLKSHFRTLTWSKSQVKTQFEHGYPRQIHR